VGRGAFGKTFWRDGRQGRYQKTARNHLSEGMLAWNIYKTHKKTFEEEISVLSAETQNLYQQM